MTFVRLEDLIEEQRATMGKVQTIIRDRRVPVSDLGALLPLEPSIQAVCLHRELGQFSDPQTE